MNTQINIIFFGSTSDSVIVLDKLCTLHFALCTLRISAVVTQPPRPIGRTQIMTPTPVETWGKEHHVPVLSFLSDKNKPWLYQNESQVIDSLQPFKADLLVSACYGQKIPTATIHVTKYGGLNVHPSILPRWRGTDPVPWAIYAGDHQTGVTIVTLAEKFDKGKIIAQKKIPITPTDTSDPMRTKLFTIGANLLTNILASKGLAFQGKPASQPSMPYARRLTRDDGFEPWEVLQRAMSETGKNDATRIDRKFRAFTPWPGLWTKIQVQRAKGKGQSEEQRLKILSCHLSSNHLILDAVQLAGKAPVSFSQFSSAYLAS